MGRIEMLTKSDEICRRCTMEHRKNNPFDYGGIELREMCETCDVGVKRTQMDNPKFRGLVGTWKKW